MTLPYNNGAVTIVFFDGAIKRTLTGTSGNVNLDSETEVMNVGGMYLGAHHYVSGVTTHTLKTELTDITLLEEWVVKEDLLRKLAEEYMKDVEMRKRGDRSPLIAAMTYENRVKELYDGAPADIISEATAYVAKLLDGATIKVEYVVTLNDVVDAEDDDDDWGYAHCEDCY